MRNILFVLIFVSSILLSCNNNYEPLPKEIIVAGKIINTEENSPKVIRIDFTDVFANFSSRAQIINKDSSFRITYFMPYATEFQVEYSKYIPLYAEPGDSIFMTIDAKRIKSDDYTNAVEFSGDRADINNSLWKGLEYIRISLLPLYYGNHPSDSLSVSEYNQILEEKILILYDSISNFTRINNIPSKTEKILKKIIDYDISVFWVQKYKRDDDSTIAFAERHKLLENDMFGTYDPASFNYMGWHNHSFNYVDALFHQYAANDYYNDEWLKGWEKVRDVLKEKPGGFNRDYITAKIIDYFGEPADSLPGAWNLISSQFVKDYIVRLQNQKMPAFDDINIPGISYLTAERTIEAVPSTNFIKSLSARYPGKVIYIDVWGTWCSSCKALFPDAKLRKEEMKDKDVVFVYLCITSKMESWLKDIETFQLEGEHYFLDEDASKLFTINYHIASYPRYMIVGKDGKVKTNEASKPSWKQQFTKEIESYL